MKQVIDVYGRENVGIKLSPQNRTNSMFISDRSI